MQSVIVYRNLSVEKLRIKRPYKIQNTIVSAVLDAIQDCHFILFVFEHG